MILSPKEIVKLVGTLHETNHGPVKGIVYKR